MDGTAYCKPHLERTGEEVIATHVVNGEPFCRLCFLGGTPGTRRNPRACTPKGIDGALVLKLCRKARVIDVAARLGIRPSTVHYYLKREKRMRGAEI